MKNMYNRERFPIFVTKPPVVNTIGRVAVGMARTAKLADGDYRDQRLRVSIPLLTK
jgi:hypothetical protein